MLLTFSSPQYTHKIQLAHRKPKTNVKYHAAAFRRPRGRVTDVPSDNCHFGNLAREIRALSNDQVRHSRVNCWGRGFATKRLMWESRWVPKETTHTLCGRRVESCFPLPNSDFEAIVDNVAHTPIPCPSQKPHSVGFNCSATLQFVLIWDAMTVSAVFTCQPHAVKGSLEQI